MAYFRYFPKILYDVRGVENQEQYNLVTNLLARVLVNCHGWADVDGSSHEALIGTCDFEKHIIVDGETPEILANKFYSDSELRIADCQFALKNYWPAMEGYNKIINSTSNKIPYAIYQKAISYGFVDRNEMKIETLKLLIKKFPNSSYADDSLFELAMTLSFENRLEESIIYYENILKDFQKSPYFLKAKLNKGLILYNQGFYKKSRVVLEEFIKQNESSSLIQEALNVLKEIAIDEGSFSEFTRWIKKENLNIQGRRDLNPQPSVLETTVLPN